MIDINRFRPAIVYTIYIAATPEKVWLALTSAEFSRQYFSGFAVELEQKIGGAFKVLAPDGSLHVSGEVIEHDPPRKLVRHMGRELARTCRSARLDTRHL
jgi:uncharacterized protein YndB with AHSA1/START domain